MTTAVPNLTLYYSPGACSFVPHIVLAESGLPFAIKATPIPDGAHLAPEYLQLNPQGRVPVLLVDGEVLTEVPAILVLLSRLARHLSLWPSEPLAEARMASYMAWLSSTVHISFAGVWRPQRFTDIVADHLEIQAKARREVPVHYTRIESRLAATRYVMGDRLTAADYYTLIFYRWGWRIGLDMRQYLHWHRHAEEMHARPGVKRALDAEGITLFPP